MQQEQVFWEEVSRHQELKLEILSALYFVKQWQFMVL